MFAGIKPGGLEALFHSGGERIKRRKNKLGLKRGKRELILQERINRSCRIRKEISRENPANLCSVLFL